MNIITVTGNSVKDIELKATPSGSFVGNGTIAVRRDFKNKQTGEYETDFINFVALGKTAEIMAQYVNKGDHFGITGRLQIRIWNKDDGTKQYFTEIVVNSFDFPQKKKEGASNNQYANNNAPAPMEVTESDLPF
ncbi:single-stranded DNA-binding protein [Solibacillus sp. FSL W7-1436]|uniref:single-stranded DNA-binding protein n=1 Tax=Solibacillus sp. FSL W7-1436 TaxID=2921705 RepID=UPI0030F4DD56